MIDETLTESQLRPSSTNRYLVFAGPDYNPRGGADDFIMAINDKEFAVSLAQSLIGAQVRSSFGKDDYEWTQVFDIARLATVYDSRDDRCE